MLQPLIQLMLLSAKVPMMLADAAANDAACLPAAVAFGLAPAEKFQL